MIIPKKWHGCYESSWKGVITDASFAHPAKFSRSLIERIFDHCLQCDYIHKGDVVGDPFGGIATGGITAAYRGLTWVGVELEPKFVAMARANIGMHQARWKTLNAGYATILKGDSRKFHEVYREAAAVITSPPYVSGGHHADQTGAWNTHGYGLGLTQDLANYGVQEGQIGRLKSGSVDGVISSPPYADIAAGAGGLNTKPAKKPGQQSGRSADAASQDTDQKYGTEPGQISRCMGGESVGQIGKDKGETYWQAMAQVYASCFQAIKPGGVIVLVLKDYVKDKKKGTLCDDSARLIERVGFTVIERIHAMLVAEQTHGDLFTGSTTTTKSRKSFFRRLTEARGSPKIDYEEVIIGRKL